MSKTPFTEEFAVALQERARAVCGTDLIHVSLVELPDCEVKTRRMLNKAPIAANFVSEIQGDIDLTKTYTGKRVMRFELVLIAHWKEGMVNVASYQKKVTTW